MKIAWLVVLLFPLLCFCVAGVNELRLGKTVSAKLGNFIPSLLGIGAFAIACGLGRVLHLGPDSFVANGRVMSVLCAVIASSSAFVQFSRKSSGVFVALGGLELVFFYAFFSEVVT